jgi:hypothetical protein
MDGMERSSGSFIKDSQKRKDCTDDELIADARRRGAIDRGIVEPETSYCKFCPHCQGEIN